MESEPIYTDRDVFAEYCRILHEDKEIYVNRNSTDEVKNNITYDMLMCGDPVLILCDVVYPLVYSSKWYFSCRFNET